MDINNFLETISRITEAKKYSTEEIAEFVSEEGLEHVIKVYDPKNFENEDLKILWTQAKDALRKIEEILEPYES